VISAVDPATGDAGLFATVVPGHYGLGLTIDRDGVVYGMSTDATFRAYAPGGKLLWQVPLPDGGLAFSAGAIAADGTIYVGTASGPGFTSGALIAIGP